MRNFIFILAFVGISCSSFAQEEKSISKHVYFGWGYTRAWYSKSSIHFINNSNAYNPVTNRYDNYDFTIHNATAHDRPDFDAIKDVINITIPQFVGRLGYSFNKKWAFEINYDHTKYVVDDYQKLHITGRFNDTWVDCDTILSSTNLLHFEHTDGANFWMFNLVRKWDLLKINKVFGITWMLKPGAGVVVPRTDVTLFGQRLNNNWKLAGWITGVETGARFCFFNRAYVEFVGKAVYADYVNAFVLGRHHGRASHHFFATQLTLTVGYQFFRKNKASDSTAK